MTQTVQVIFSCDSGVALATSPATCVPTQNDRWNRALSFYHQDVNEPTITNPGSLKMAAWKLQDLSSFNDGLLRQDKSYTDFSESDNFQR
ncbi:hypothetical protein CERSUDRAFT_117384 [Gelatoporia subvermispora B]|uniref:Uncharacterized protein n=1 Tax=Ceriporiopsis subvermispora (strain B) TaxID=914234 RepID=M2QAA3_CERS8|nr:hypothetical protein CERSUDRAFT_117384 [Gelatoporia subvermispora B]